MSGGLFQDFEKQTVADWAERLQEDLRGKPLDSLLWKTRGLEGKPFYTAEDLDFEPFNYSHFSQEPQLLGDRFWVNYQPIQVEDSKESNLKALKALSNGANGIIFELDGMPELSVLLNNIQLEYCHIAFHLNSSIEPKQFGQSYKEYLESIGSKKVAGHILSNSCGLTEINGLRTIGIEVPNHNHAALELALAMSSMIETIDNLSNSGASTSECLNKVFLKLGLSNDFFLEIARHRAARRLFDAVASGYGTEFNPLEIISCAGPWGTEIDDAHSFMLHATTQAMSAILGGTDSLMIQPFYNVFPNKPALAERIARNISSILSEESYLGKMVDPAAGSYYLEQLTNTLYNDSLALLRKMEAAGGISKIDVEQFKSQAL